MAQALITGASGFIGAHLVAALTRRGDEVTCLVRPTSNTTALKSFPVQFLHGDVTDPQSVQKAVAGHDVVYHLAGRTMALKHQDYFDANQNGVRNVATACAAQLTPPTLVTVSSLAACGPAPDGIPLVESDLPVPVSDYGRSKRAGEREAEAFADRVPITIVRPPIVLGEGDRVGFDLFWSIARFGIHAVPGLGRHRFSLIHADDLAELIILAGLKGKRLPGEKKNGSVTPGKGYYFAACEEDLIYDDLGRMVAEAMGSRFVFPLHLPIPVVWLVSCGVEIAGQMLRQPQYLQLDKACEVTAGSWVCSPQAAIADLGFQVGLPIFNRLRQTVEWYRSKGWL